MSYSQRVFACVVLACACLFLASCGFNPLSIGTSQAPVTPAPSKAATSSVAATAAAPVVPARTPFAKTPAPRLYDPLLANGSWGYHKKNRIIETKLKTGVTLAFHEDMELAEADALAAEQTKSLLKVFRNSTKVDRWIDAAGGDSDETTYTVLDIQANPDAVNDTPWVYAVLRAGFPTNDGSKALECYVYRQKTDKGLDNRPFVSNVIVGYQTIDGTIPNPKHLKIR